MMLATRPKIPRWDDEHVTLGQLCRECETYLLGVRGYSPLTLNGYRLVWDQFRAYLRSQNKQDQIKEFTAAACIGFMTDLAARGVIVNTIISKLAALSTLAQHAMIREDERTGKPLLAANPTRAFDWPTYQETETKFLLPDELKAFLAVALPINEAVARDLMMDTGLRVSELCRANVEDLIEIDGLWSLAVIVKGRGRRQRKIHSPVSLPVVQVLHEHLVSRKISGPTKDPLLVNQRGQRYNRHSLQYVIRKTARQAGIERFRVSPHKIRHTKNVVRRVGGIDDTTRSRLLGQTSPRSQERYDHIIPSELHAAKEKEAEGLARYLRRISESGQ